MAMEPKSSLCGVLSKNKSIVHAVMHKGPGSSPSFPQLGDTHSSVPTLGPPVTLNLGTLQASLRGPAPAGSPAHREAQALGPSGSRLVWLL